MLSPRFVVSVVPELFPLHTFAERPPLGNYKKFFLFFENSENPMPLANEDINLVMIVCNKYSEIVFFFIHGKKWFCYGNKIRDNKYLFFLLLQPKILLQQPNVLLIELKFFVVVTKYFCCPYFNK